MSDPADGSGSDKTELHTGEPHVFSVCSEHQQPDARCPRCNVPVSSEKHVTETRSTRDGVEAPIVTREDITAGLQAGRTLCIDRRDAPALPIVMEMASEGLVTTELRQLDEQSSVLRVRWSADTQEHA